VTWPSRSGILNDHFYVALQTFKGQLCVHIWKHLKHYLVSHATRQSCEEQSLVFVETAVFSRLVKVPLSALKLSTAGWCTVQLWFLLDNSLRSVRGTGLFRVIYRHKNLCQCPSDRQHWQKCNAYYTDKTKQKNVREKNKLSHTMSYENFFYTVSLLVSRDSKIGLILGWVLMVGFIVKFQGGCMTQ